MFVEELERLGVTTVLLSVELPPVPARTIVLLRVGVVTVLVEFALRLVQWYCFLC